MNALKGQIHKEWGLGDRVFLYDLDGARGKQVGGVGSLQLPRPDRAVSAAVLALFDVKVESTTGCVLKVVLAAFICNSARVREQALAAVSKNQGMGRSSPSIGNKVGVTPPNNQCQTTDGGWTTASTTRTGPRSSHSSRRRMRTHEMSVCTVS